jgi:Putative prokaryotic signal transducing protein
MGVLTRTPPPPPAATDSEGGGGDGGSEWIELVRARDNIDAHLLQGRLTEAGIESMRVVDRFAPGAWLYGGSNPWAPVVILVRRRQLEEGRLILAEIAFAGPPAARSVSSGPSPRLRAAWWVAAVGLGAVLTLAGLVQIAQSLPQSTCARLPLCSELGSVP